jgi:glycosyltransferase involved in cell wall biosynthesis
MTALLDMTPTVINRTAVFNIALDTAKAFRDRTRAWRYGDRFLNKVVEDRGELAAFAPEIFRLILGDKGLRDEFARPFGRRRERAIDSPMLFFDPLYILIDEVREGDVVLVLDISPLTNSEWHNARVCGLYRTAYARLLSSKARVAAISRHTAMALWANFGLNPNRTCVVPLYLRLGVNEAGSTTSTKPDKRLLCIGSLETRKNLMGLCLAFEHSGLWSRGYTLSLVGGDGHGACAIKDLASTIRGVELHGFLPDAELRKLYRSSLAFVYPSFLEGFGLPLLEAMSWGLPVLTSTTGAPPEFAGPDAVIVDPYDVHAISNGLKSLAELDSEGRGSIGTRNRRLASQYTFERYIGVMRNLVFGVEAKVCDSQRMLAEPCS